MSACAWHDAPPAARILCAGDKLGDPIQMQCCLEGPLDFVIISGADEAATALAGESPFDVIILDQHIERLGGRSFLDRLRDHSPEAERLIVVHHTDQAMRDMLEGESRVMRLLQAPLADDVLCGAVADALLRHRARALRASTLPSVTPMGGNPCCTAQMERRVP